MNSKRITTKRALIVPVALGALLSGCGEGDDSTADPASSASSAVPSSPSQDPTASASDEVPAPAVPGLVVHLSDADVPTTVKRLEDTLNEAGKVVATVDHAAAAASVDLELAPTTLVLGGNPLAGTPVMQAEQSAGVDLPQKYLVWEESGEVYVGYNSAEYVATRAGLDPADPALEKLRAGSAMVAAEASASAAPLSEGEDASTAGADDYLVTSTSNTDVAGTIQRYTDAFAKGDLMSPATVDHAANAASVDLDLRPTSVTFAGNPEVGTLLMQSEQTMGIDLPLRFAAYEEDDGTVRVAHPDIAVLAERHGLTGVDEVVAMVQKATAALSKTAAEG